MQGDANLEDVEVDKKQMKALEEVLSVDIPEVMRRFDDPF